MNEKRFEDGKGIRRHLSFVNAGRRAVLAGVLAGALALGMAGCASTTPQVQGDNSGTAQSQQQEGGSSVNGASADALRANVAAMDFEYSDRDLAGTYDEAAAVRVDLSAGTVEGEGASFDAVSGVLTVSQEGTYLLFGTLDQGQVVIDADHDVAKVQLVLDEVSIANATGPAVYVKSVDKVFVTTAEGTNNTLSSGSSFTLEDGEDEPDATLFSKDDLTLNGKGTLTIEGNYQNAVTSKDDLVIGGGTYVVTAVKHGLKGKDCVKMAAGDVAVTAGGDGVKSTNDEDTARGFVSIDGGTLAVESEDDGIDAQWYFRVMDGTVNVTAADDAFHSESDGLIGGGDITVNAGDDAFHTEYELIVDGGNIDVRSCVEGYESQQVIVNGGTSNLVASDDAINAAVAEPYSADESTTVDAAAQYGAENQRGGQPQDQGNQASAASENGARAAYGDGSGNNNENDQGTQGQDGTNGRSRQDQQPPDMPEGGFGGQNGQRPQTPPDGEMPEASEGGFDGQAPADGQQPPQMPEGGFESESGQRPEMPADGQVPQGQPGGLGEGTAEVSEECLIQINGGTIIIKAGGDGLDSNGNIELNGGVVYVSDVSTGADGAIDYELGATSNGGTLIAVGPAGMAMGLSGGSVPFAMANVSGNAGQTVAVVNGGGQVLASMEAQGAFQNVVVASSDFTEGESVSIVVGGSLSGVDTQGKGGSVSGGSSSEVTVSTTATQAGPMGGMGGRDGQVPDGAQGQIPEGDQGQAPNGGRGNRSGQAPSDSASGGVQV